MPETIPSPLPSILVIEDDDIVARGLARWLGDTFRVTTESTATDACGRLALGERFSVILSDILMPGMSGIDFYDWLCDAAPEQARRVLFLTGVTEPDHIVRFQERMGPRVLYKPVQREQLLRRIESVLTGA